MLITIIIRPSGPYERKKEKNKQKQRAQTSAKVNPVPMSFKI